MDEVLRGLGALALLVFVALVTWPVEEGRPKWR